MLVNETLVYNSQYFLKQKLITELHYYFKF